MNDRRTYRASESDSGKARGRNASKTYLQYVVDIPTDNAVQNRSLNL